MSTASVIIAAHNEEAVIGRCLDSVLEGSKPGEFDVTVVANGCRDATAAQARRRPGVRVIETAQPGKANALNLGDAAAVGFPRFYLDADIVVTANGLRILATALSSPEQHPRLSGRPLAVVPRRRLVTDGRPILVRGFFAINSRLPAYRDSLFGRGLIGLAEDGRRRFDTFPGMIADDLFLDSLFDTGEKVEVNAIAARVETPLTTGDLVRRLARVRRGNAEMRTSAAGDSQGVRVRRAARLSFLRDVVLPDPWLAPAGLAYAGITVVAAVIARRRTAGPAMWGHDQSTRMHSHSEPGDAHE